MITQSGCNSSTIKEEKGNQQPNIIYILADDSHYLKNKESYQISEKQVNCNSKIQIKLAPGGGNAIWLRQIK